MLNSDQHNQQLTQGNHNYLCPEPEGKTTGRGPYMNPGSQLVSLPQDADWWAARVARRGCNTRHFSKGVYDFPVYCICSLWKKHPPVTLHRIIRNTSKSLYNPLSTLGLWPRRHKSACRTQGTLAKGVMIFTAMQTVEKAPPL